MLIESDREEAHNENTENDARSDLAVHGYGVARGDDSWVASFVVVISGIGSTDRRLESIRVPSLTEWCSS